MSIIKIYTKNELHSEIETADDVNYIELDGNRLMLLPNSGEKIKEVYRQ